MCPCDTREVKIPAAELGLGGWFFGGAQNFNRTAYMPGSPSPPYMLTGSWPTEGSENFEPGSGRKN